METECFSLVTDGLTMRKDVKRSLVIWPLSASILVVGIFWFALQADPGSKVLMAGVIDLMNAYRNGDSAPANQELPVSSLETSVPNSRKTHTEFSAGAVSGRLAPHPTDGMPSNAWEDLASIESWSDTSFELRQPAVAGIPAPSLNATSDIFGFEAELELSATTDSLRDTLAGALPSLGLPHSPPLAASMLFFTCIAIYLCGYATMSQIMARLTGNTWKVTASIFG